MKIPVFYNPKMAVDSQGYSPSAEKARKCVDAWGKEGLIKLNDCLPASMHELLLAHDPKYVHEVVSLRRANGHGNRISEVTGAAVWNVGSMIAAATEAVRNGRVACSPTSGFHHASYANGGGFCTFNGLMSAARKILLTTSVEKIGIVDCDWHYGDGTDDIIREFKIGRNRIAHWTMGASAYDKAGEMIRAMSKFLDSSMRDCGLILYQAGADPHKADPLGGLFTNAELVERDRALFGFCRLYRIPVAWNLAGGYQKNKSGGIPKVIGIHLRTMRVCSQVYSESW